MPLLLFLLIQSCKITETGDEYEPAEKIKREIHLIDLTDKSDTLLALGSFPQFSLDGNKIIYLKDSSDGINWRRIMVMDLNGGNKRAISGYYDYLNGVFCSPVRPQIVFSAWDFTNRTSDLFIVDEDGANLRNLTNTVDQNELQPAFSPDGNIIVFVQIGHRYRIKTLNITGGEQKILKTSDQWRLKNPRFTLNGSKIIYSEESNRVDGPRSVRLMDVADPLNDRILENILPTLLVTYSGRLVFSERYKIKGYDLVLDKITEIGSGNPLALSPDGSKIVFHKNRMNVDYLLLMNYDGGGIDTLVADRYEWNRFNFRYYPQISKDKTKIVFTKEYWYYE